MKISASSTCCFINQYSNQHPCFFPQAVVLGAPMLIMLGYPKFESVIVLLLANTFATVFGAAGTPTWYGFCSLGLSEEVRVGIMGAECFIFIMASFTYTCVSLTINFPARSCSRFCVTPLWRWLSVLTFWYHSFLGSLFLSE